MMVSMMVNTLMIHIIKKRQDRGIKSLGWLHLFLLLYFLLLHMALVLNFFILLVKYLLI